MHILVLDGIGSFGRTSNVIDHTVHRLAESIGGRVHWIPWEASMMGIGGETLWPESSRRGTELIKEYMDTYNESVVLLAYSGGNRPVHEFLNQYPEYHHRILAVGLMSDPWRPHDRSQSGAEYSGNGYGIMGQDYGPIPDRTYWTTVQGDCISDAAPDSLLRYAATSTDVHLTGAIDEFVRRAQSGRLQLIPFLGLPIHEWFFGLGGRIQRSLEEARGYVSTGKHTRGYIDPHRTSDGDDRSLAYRLADTISWKVRSTQ